MKSQFKLENGKYVAPSSLEENLKLSPLVEQAVLDGRNMKNTFLIVHPNLEALRSAASSAGVSVDTSDEAMCKQPEVRNWLLGELQTNNMKAPDWKGYEVAKTIILDHEEWTTDNDMMTPSMKVKLRNLLSKFDEEIQTIQ